MWKLLNISKLSALTVCQLITKSKLRLFLRARALSFSICHRKLLFNVYITYSTVYVGNGSYTRKLSVHGMWSGI
jgi:hypothetical protein